MNLRELYDNYGIYIDIDDYIVENWVDENALREDLLRAKKYKDIDDILEKEVSSFEEQMHVLENGKGSQIAVLARISNLNPAMQEIMIDRCCAVDRWSIVGRKDFDPMLHGKIALMDCPGSNAVLLSRHEVSLETINKMLCNENQYIRENAEKELLNRLQKEIKI